MEKFLQPRNGVYLPTPSTLEVFGKLREVFGGMGLISVSESAHQPKQEG